MFLIVLFMLILFQVLFKSRCENRLNEITERAIADKREVNSMIPRIVLVLHVHEYFCSSYTYVYLPYYFRLNCLVRNMKRSTNRLLRSPQNWQLKRLHFVKFRWYYIISLIQVVSVSWTDKPCSKSSNC